MKKILLYNGMNFHNELFGTFLDYFNNIYKNCIVDCYFIHDHLKYFEMYNIFFKFNIITSFRPDDYDLIIVLTDSDWSYKKEWINSKTICINHWYQSRNLFIDKQINIGPFYNKNGIYNSEYILPTYNTITQKFPKTDSKHITDINVCILGRFIPDKSSDLDFLRKNNANIKFHVINVHGIHPDLLDKKDIIVHTNINTIDLYNLLLNSQYIYITDTNHEHLNGYSVSASIGLGFITLCNLIIPEKMNRHLRLKTAITYKNTNDPITLEIYPKIHLIEEEREYFLNKRNKILNKLLE